MKRAEKMYFLWARVNSPLELEEDILSVIAEYVLVRHKVMSYWLTQTAATKMRVESVPLTNWD